MVHEVRVGSVGLNTKSRINRVGSKWKVIWLAEGCISCESEVEGTQMLWGRYVPTEDLSSTPEVIVKENTFSSNTNFFKI